MTKEYLTIAAALYVGTLGIVLPAAAVEKTQNVSISISRAVEFSEKDLGLLKEQIQSNGLHGGTGGLSITVESIAIRPGGTPATLRQLGGHDALRLTISKGGREESILVTSRTEGLLDQSLRGRKAKLFNAAARVVKHRTA